MIRLWSFAVALAVTSSITRPIAVRIQVREGGGIVADSTISAPLMRGLVADSTLGVIEAVREMPLGGAHLVLVQTTVATTADSVTITARAINVLARVIVPTETVRIARTNMDSTLTSFGQELAIQLRKRLP